MSKTLRVAVVGTGYFSQFHFDAWSRCDEVEVVGVASLDRIEAERIASEHNIPAVFDDLETMLDSVQPDLLDVITPPPTHRPFIEEAAKRGIDIVCQKPFCGNLQEATLAVDAAEKSEVTLVVHENFRFQPWYQAITEMVKNSRVGRPYRALFRLRPGDGQGPEAYLGRQGYFQEMERFIVHETLVHHIDVARAMFGDPSSVYGDVQRLNPAIAGEDSALIIMEHENDLRVVLDGNRLSDHKAENLRRTMGELLVEGELGTISLNGDGEIFFRAHGSQVEENVPNNWREHGFGADCVYRFTRHVVDHFLNNAPLQTEARAYLINQRIEETAYESSRLKQQIDLN